MTLVSQFDHLTSAYILLASLNDSGAWTVLERILAGRPSITWVGPG